MRTTVALVEAHPESIAQDYRRLLDLAGLLPGTGVDGPSVILGTGAGGFQPGWGATPWQLDATLTSLGERAAGCRVCRMSATGAGPVPAHPVWQGCLDRHRAVAAGDDFLRLHTHTSSLLHPALDADLSAGVRVPVGLAGGPALLLAAPALRPGWGVAAAGTLLKSVVVGSTGRRGRLPLKRRAPTVEVTAEAIGVARELMPDLGVVLDGTLWGVASGRRSRGCVARNILLAGTDPLAVDAVAMRLAGLDPLQVPWLRLCRDRGFGSVAPSEIRVVGRTDITDLDFGMGNGTFAAGPRPAPAVGHRARWPGMRRRSATEAVAGTAWARLTDEYVTGGEPLGEVAERSI